MDFQSLHRFVKTNDYQFFKSAKTLDIISLQSKHRDSLLHIACRYDRREILETLVIDHNADIEVSNDEGKKPLHEAAQSGGLKCLSYLLEIGSHVDPLKRADWTPLMLACTKQCADVVQCLLDYGANPCLKNKDGWNTFHIASREGNLPILQALLRNSPSVWDTKSKNLRTPLHTSALHGHIEVVSWILENLSYNVDDVDSCGVSAVMDALRSGHVDIASVLISDYQADASIQDKVGRQAIHHVAQTGEQRALEYLLSTAKIPVNTASILTGETPLHTAAKEGQASILEVLIRHGADVNHIDKQGRTALHIASGAQSMPCVRQLLHHGALILTDHSGRTPVEFAVKQDVKDMFAFVVK